MGWYKSSNYKASSSNPLSGFVGDLIVQSGVSVDGQILMNSEYINAYNKPAVPRSVNQSPYWEGLGGFLTIKEQMLSNGFVYKMPTWSTLPIASTNFPTGVTISGYLYQPFRMRICNGGANYTVELLGRIVP
jgi:hypothetical protein